MLAFIAQLAQLTTAISPVERLSAVEGSIQTTPDGIRVSWYELENSLIHHEYVVELENLDASTKELNLTVVLANASSDLSRTLKTELYVWTEVTYEFTLYSREKTFCWTKINESGVSEECSFELKEKKHALTKEQWVREIDLTEKERKKNSFKKSFFGSWLAAKPFTASKKWYKIVFDLPAKWNNAGVIGVEVNGHFVHPLWNTGYRYRRLVNATTNLNTNLTAFAVWINTTSPYGHSTNCFQNGTAFSNSTDGGSLPYEYEPNTTACGQVAGWWVRFENLVNNTYGGVSTYFYNDSNSTAANSSNATGVWNSSFMAVLHFANSSDVLGFDSTGNSRTFESDGIPVLNSTGVFGNAVSVRGGNLSASPVGWLSTARHGLTVEAWVRLNGSTNGGSKVFRSQGGDIDVFMTTTQRFCQFNGAPQINQDPAVGLSFNVWHHIACAFNGTHLQFYIDGVLNATATQLVNTLSLNQRLYIGNEPAANRFFNGDIDEVRISNASLSADYFSAVYNQSMKTYGNSEAPAAAASGSLTWSGNTTNVSVAGYSTLFNATWTANNSQLSVFVFEFDNGNGTLQNVTQETFTSSNASVVRRVVNSTAGSVIRWRFYGNTTSGLMNATPILVFTPNEIYFEAFDEGSPDNPVNFSLQSINSTATITHTSNTTAFMRNRAPAQAAMRFEFSNSSYYLRKFYYTVGASTTITQRIYLVRRNDLDAAIIVFHVVDDFGVSQSNVNVTLYKTISGVQYVMGTELTTSDGNSVFYVRQSDAYTAYFSNGIVNVTQTITAVDGKTYEVLLSTAGAVTSLNLAFQNITVYTVLPTHHIYSPFTTISFLINSSKNDLDYFNLTLQYPNGTLIATTNASSRQGGILSFNFSRAGRGPNLTITTTHKTIYMTAERSFNWTRQIFHTVNASSENSIAPPGLSLSRVRLGYSGFAYTILPVLGAAAATGMVAVFAPAQAGLAIIFAIIVGMFVWIGWLNSLVFFTFAAAAVAFVYLNSRSGA